MEKQISTGLKVWLWFVIVVNGLSAVKNVFNIGSSPLSTVISIVVEAALIYACVMIMFQMKKFGFKLMCIVAIVNAVLSILIMIIAGAAAGALTGSAAVGLASGAIGIVVVIIGAALCPLITYLLMKSQWEIFE